MAKKTNFILIFEIGNYLKKHSFISMFVIEKYFFQM